MNKIRDYLMGYYILSDMLGRPLFMLPPRATTLVALFEDGKLDDYLRTIGFEFDDEDDIPEPCEPRKFGDREEFDRSKVDPKDIHYSKLRIRKISRER